MINTPSGATREAGYEHAHRRVLNTRDAARYLGLAVSTLNKWRCHGGGPEFLKLGRAVRYRQQDLDAFLASRRLRSTASY